MTPDRLGPYRIERLLGQGGMGSVYLAEHEETKQQAAVKTLSSSLSRDEDFRERFAGEIESLKKLRHPNIVQLFGWGEQEGVLFYAMEAIDGKSLQERLAEGDRIEWREAIQIGIDVCKALKHAHDSGIIHRDLKPANLLCDGEGKVKLTDFGIAKLFGYTQLTAEGGVVGTADYMAPEQALGQSVNHRCDLYSLGTVLYTLLAGRPPFLAKSMPEVVHKVCYEPPQPIRRFNASVPPQLESLIGELLEKDPTKRPPTARALTTRLEAMQHGLTESRQKSTENKPNAQSTEFDYSEPGETQAPGSPRVHSATTRFAPSEGDDSNGEKTAVGETIQTGAPLAEKPATEAPQRDATVNVDSGAQRPSRSLNSEVESQEKSSGTRFTTLEEASQRTEEERLHEQRTQRWIIAAMAVSLLGIAGFVMWQTLVPPSADSLYASIQQSLKSDPENTATVERDIQNFLEIYPEEARAQELREILTGIELDRMQRSMSRRERQGDALESLSLPERAYAEANELARSRPDLAIEYMQAVIDVYGGMDDADSQQVVDLAQRQIEKLKARVEAEQKANEELLQSRIAEAEKLEEEDPQRARAIYNGLVLLYLDQPWAADVVRHAQTRLQAMDAAAE